jgi:sulfite exporter TauE/SafE
MSLAGGVLLGLASSLHCAAMCGGIATSLMLSGPQAGPPAYRALLLTHLGRISAYMLAGIAVGAAGASMIGWLDREVAFRLLQWGGAVALMWIGLSTAGVLPGPSWLDRALSPLSNRIARLASRLSGRRPAPYLTGLAWGLMPCAMVYGALFTAMLTGSATGGATVMAGFGLGTLPGLALTTLGIRALVRAEMRADLRTLAGFAIALFGFATVWVPHPTLAALCLPS